MKALSYVLIGFVLAAVGLYALSGCEWTEKSPVSGVQLTVEGLREELKQFERRSGQLDELAKAEAKREVETAQNELGSELSKLDAHNTLEVERLQAAFRGRLTSAESKLEQTLLSNAEKLDQTRLLSTQAADRLERRQNAVASSLAVLRDNPVVQSVPYANTGFDLLFKAIGLGGIVYGMKKRGDSTANEEKAETATKLAVQREEDAKSIIRGLELVRAKFPEFKEFFSKPEATKTLLKAYTPTAKALVEEVSA